ncbi:1-deoxy-D-xylulose-5-phosphate reductoisomerase [Rhodospirillales bacterium]|nr:1-deoxy-D-xylulose-5-phosphate reductoisomerase [Rhodospirillales bacterium]
MEMSAPQNTTSKPIKPRSVSVLGSTGSIGCNTLDLIARNLEHFSVVALTGNRNVQLLAEQARIFRPELVVVATESSYMDLKKELSGTNIRIAAGDHALEEAANLNSDLVMAGIVGIAGLKPTIIAIRRGATVALANKECLVCAGNLLFNELNKYGGTLLPVDSEHNAIFQVFDFKQSDTVEKLILTASGGPFRETPIDKMARITPTQAIAHPNWDMGAKISVDSATMMNKGLELIEAFYLFPINEDQIEILVHPQSVIHSMVAYTDGSVLAQLGTPDMRTPISYALNWPKRLGTPSPQLDLVQIASLTFEAPDFKRFPALTLAKESLSARGAAPTVLNAANEIAVKYFLDHKIGFLDIVKIVGQTLDKQTFKDPKTIEEVNTIDKEARIIALELVSSITSVI